MASMFGRSQVMRLTGGVSTARMRACTFLMALIITSPCSLGVLPIAFGDSTIVTNIALMTDALTHNLIRIEGDDEFTAENGVLGGNGTQSDPYVIASWAFDMSDQHWRTAAVHIANTTAVFIVQDLYIHSDAEQSNLGVYLENVTHGAIDSSTIDGISRGVYVESSRNVTIARIDFISSDCQIYGSDNVTFTRNECYGVMVSVSGSSDVSVTYNEVNYTLSSDSPKGLTAKIWSSDNCRIAQNTFWSAVETGPRTASITLGEATNCSVFGNSMNEHGIGIDAREIEHLSTHEISNNNTVRMLPLRFYSNTAGVLIEQVDFGQLIVANCTDVHLRDLTFQSLPSRAYLLFNSNVDVNDCAFIDSGALHMSCSSDVRIRHNAFVDMRETFIRYISGLNLSDNDFTSSPSMYLDISNVTDSSFESNLFAADTVTLVVISGSTNVTVRNNQFSLQGLRLGGTLATQYNSHTIDESNLAGGEKPILYLRDESHLTIDMSNYSQLLMGNCTGMDIHSLVTTTFNAIQIGFSEEVTVHDCKIYGESPIDLSYADRVSFIANDFVNPVWLMHLSMTHNVTTYHCNMLGFCGGFTYTSGPYSPTNILWDNGYPDGGNYWENMPKDDNYSGPNQDVLGSDGICDQSRSLGNLGVDRYPLVNSYVGEQNPQPEDGWQDTALWLSAIAVIVLGSSLISYFLFVREYPRKPGKSNPDEAEQS
jgi:hypothetical protein